MRGVQASMARKGVKSYRAGVFAPFDLRFEPIRRYSAVSDPRRQIRSRFHPRHPQICVGATV